MTGAPGQRGLKANRPAVTGLFACGSAFWAACASSYSLSRGLALQTCAQLAAASMAACAALAVLAFASRRKSAALVASFAVMGAFFGFAAAASCHAAAGQLDGSCSAGMVLRLVEDTRETSAGESAFAELELEGGRVVSVLAEFASGGPRLCGDRLKVSGDAVPRGADDGYLWRNGAAGRIRVKTSDAVADSTPIGFLRAARATAIDGFGGGGEERCLLQALVCGYRHDMAGASLYARFQRCGLAHLVAVSGAHLVIVTGLAASLLRAARVPRRASIALLVGLMAAYLVMSGLPVSAVRASIMSSAGIMSLLGRRRPSALNALGLSMVALVAVDPPASVSASFALSALSTAGIVLFAPLVESWLAPSPLGRASFAVEALSLTLSSAVLAQPLSCALFNQMPVVAPVSNVVCAPLFPLACGAGLLAGLVSCVAPAAGPAAVGLSAVPAFALGKAVAALSCIPFASVPVSLDAVWAVVASLAAAAVLWVAWPAFDARAVACASCAAVLAAGAMAFAAFQEDSIVMLDVGQGDAFLIRSRGESLLIDTGNKDAQLLGQLARAGAFRLDGVLVTHSDDDHCGSLDALERGVDVGRVMLAAGLPESEGDKNGDLVAQSRRVSREVVEIGYGDSFRVGRFKATVCWPREPVVDGGNADSVCLLVAYDGDADGTVDFRALFTGDAEKEQLGEMIASGAVGAVDLLKVGHHGSKNSMTADQLETLAPRIALIGVGRGNRYGHPAATVLDMLGAQGARVFRSDEDGQVKCTFTADSIAVALQ